MTRAVCRLCGGFVTPSQDTVDCPACAATYHLRCWDENEGCRTPHPRSPPLAPVVLVASMLAWGVAAFSCTQSEKRAAVPRLPRQKAPGPVWENSTNDALVAAAFSEATGAPQRQRAFELLVKRGPGVCVNLQDLQAEMKSPRRVDRVRAALLLRYCQAPCAPCVREVLAGLDDFSGEVRGALEIGLKARPMPEVLDRLLSAARTGTLLVSFDVLAAYLEHDAESGREAAEKAAAQLVSLAGSKQWRAPLQALGRAHAKYAAQLLPGLGRIAAGARGEQRELAERVMKEVGLGALELRGVLGTPWAYPASRRLIEDAVRHFEEREERGESLAQTLVEATLRRAAAQYDLRRTELSRYEALRAVVSDFRLACPSAEGFRLRREERIELPPHARTAPVAEAERSPESLPALWTIFSQPEKFGPLERYFVLAAGLPAAEATVVFRAVLQAGWNEAGRVLPELPWAQALRAELADSPYGAPEK